MRRKTQAATNTPTWRLVVFSASLTLMIVACSGDGETASEAPGGAAADYCAETGGQVETRYPYWNTNQDQSGWVQLPGEMELCWYETLDDDESASRIYLDLNTLYSETPTLAAAAYLARLPLGDARGNPAAANCNEQLLGATSFGNGASGGGWVNLDEEVFTVVNMCVFADGSAIDEWGIAYYSEGVVRGIDLDEVFRFDPADVPAMFG